METLTHGFEVEVRSRNAPIDYNGSTRALSDASGKATDTYDYDAYGDRLEFTGTTVNPYLFAGEQFDPNLGEYYLRARYYNPELGRFTARDPFEGFLTEPLSLAKYPYVHGNPVNATDPSGLLKLEQVATVSLLAHLITATTIGASIGSSRIFQTQSLHAELAKAQFKTCVAYNDPNCNVSGFPYIVLTAADLNDHAFHVYEAQIGYGDTFNAIGMSKILPSILTNAPRYPNDWIKSQPQCDNDAKERYELTTQMRYRVRTRWRRNRANFWSACDEYPFTSTLEGGRENYDDGLVSLRLVDLSESGRQGRLIQSFYDQVPIIYGDEFGVLPLPNTFDQLSYWVDRQGRKGRFYAAN